MVIAEKLKKIFGVPSEHEREYAQPERLADVMALIQILALHKYAHRSPDNLDETLQGKPLSADSWEEVAKKHPEFFRVKREGENTISLVARHAYPRNESEGRDPLSPDFVGSLLHSAVDIHDRQVRRSERWTYLLPIWVAIIAGGFSLIALVIKYLLTGSAA